jgi:hypothetical protein
MATALTPQPIVYSPSIQSTVVMTTELNSLVNGGLVSSNQLFTSGSMSKALFAEIFFILGTVTTMSTAACLSGWFLQSPDGVNFESVAAAPARPPDFLIPVPTTTGGSMYKTQGIIRLPSLRFKILVQNNSGQTWTASGNQLIFSPVLYQAGN